MGVPDVWDFKFEEQLEEKTKINKIMWFFRSEMQVAVKGFREVLIMRAVGLLSELL